MLFAAIVAVTWTVALPALAAPAPFCDDRGASALAAAPTLQPTDEAIARALTVACPDDDTSGFPFVAPHRATTWSLTVAEPAAPGVLLVLPPPGDSELAYLECARSALPGFHSRLERPPRG